MKLLFIFKFIICCTYSIYTQTNINSIYFRFPEGDKYNKQKFIPKNIHGTYFKQHDSLVKLTIISDSITTSHTVIFPIPKKTLLANNMSIKNDSIHGIKSSVGLPFKSINDTLYAFLEQYDQFYKSDSNSFCLEFQNSILLFETLEENLFYVIKLNAVKDTLYVTESDPSLFNEKLTKGLKIIKQKEPYYLLEKESEDWLNFFKNKGFNDSTLFYKR